MVTVGSAVAAVRFAKIGFVRDMFLYRDGFHRRGEDGLGQHRKPKRDANTARRWLNRRPRRSRTTVSAETGQEQVSGDGDAMSNKSRDASPLINWKQLNRIALPRTDPMPLARLHAPFDHRDWIFEPKLDGFRALAYIENSAARLVSRNRNTLKSFPTLTARIAASVPQSDAILDGEIVHLDAAGVPRFYELMRGRKPQHYFAFDLLWLNGRDLRGLPLVERKRLLRRIVPPQPAPVLYLDHVVERGVELFDAVCARDMEGIVAKLAAGHYTPDATSWVKYQEPGVHASGRTGGLFRGSGVARGGVARLLRPPLHLAHDALCRLAVLRVHRLVRLTNGRVGGPIMLLGMVMAVRQILKVLLEFLFIHHWFVQHAFHRRAAAHEKQV
jgi:hypothetical protein